MDLRRNIFSILVTLVLSLMTVSVTAQGLQCPSCTYITTDADIPTWARTIMDAVLNFFQNPECAKPLTGPIPEIQEETCAVQSGKVSRCSFYKGSLTAKLSLVITEVEIPLQVYQRGCFYSLPANVPSNGCHDRSSINEDKTFFQTILDKAGSLVQSLDAVNFVGEMCLCTDTYCKDSTSGVKQGVVLSYFVFIGSIIIAMITVSHQLFYRFLHM